MNQPVENKTASSGEPAGGPSAAATENKNANGGKRRRLLIVLVLLFIIAGAAYFFYWLNYARWSENTDDAYVSGHIVQVTPQVAGTVQSIRVDDTDPVKAGDLLVELDPADARVALDQAESALAQTVREVRTLYVNNNTLEAQIRARQVEVDRWKEDLARREAIAESGAVAREEIDHARNALKAAEENLTAVKEQLASNQVLTSGTSVAEHPNVQRAAARVEEAWLAWSRTRIVAPVDGQIARRNVQPGQRVAPGTPLMAVIPLDQVWVDANFKEVQLGKMRIGQAATVGADIYGSHIEYHGRVVGLGAGTGSAFALLPAQNATGNWIKVVQRVPVRIALDPKELAEHPLRIGLSMQVEVNTREKPEAQDGQASPSIPSAAGRSDATNNAVAVDVVSREARIRIEEVIRNNLKAGNGQRPTAPGR